ncbi:MAG: riboflavin kinase [Chloroflexota bacterium]|nr:riboflavin kinase [Chloroflexota bacterium]
MRVIHDLAHFPLPSSREGKEGGYVTIGVFDGVHRGHQQLITWMVEVAHSTDGVAIVLTFDPHPAIALGHAPSPLLTTVEERAELLAALGLDVLVVLPFTPATVRTPATDFVEPLIQHLHLVELWAGPDFALGHRREGNIRFLRRLGAERRFTVRVVEPLEWEGSLVSSSRVRAALKAGDVPQATGCLGRPYRLAGVVTPTPSPPLEGGLGGGGVPTANVSPSPERLIPADGVYACLAHAERLGVRPAVVSVGTRPTPTSSREWEGDEMSVVKAHLLDFDGNFCDQVLAFDFIARLRDERAFPTPETLIAQTHDDIAHVRVVLGM